MQTPFYCIHFWCSCAAFNLTLKKLNSILMYVKRLVTLIRHERLWATKVCSNKTSLPLLLLLQVKYWTRTCVTTSVCSFRRAHWITSSSRSYGTTSTFAPSLVSTSYLTTLINPQATVKRKWAMHFPVSRPYKLLSEAEPDTLQHYNSM